MIPELLDKYEFPKIRVILDSLQRHADASIFSKERAPSDRSADYSRLRGIIGECPLTNRNVQTILSCVHVNMIELAKGILTLDE